MILSVVIVNYKVKCFLYQALKSVYRAKAFAEKKYGAESIEIFVVDNRSDDNSIPTVRKHFPDVCIIENNKNLGFSKANNQALQKSNAKYCLLLNPDTFIPENSLSECLQFAEQHPDSGAIGVRMTDAFGKFAAESKRMIPKPASAFFRISGFSRIFSKSRFFNGYLCGHLPENKTAKIEAVSGAFMFLRKEALEKAGYLDEDFFMYGEDIDLSYRLLKSGYRNYYFPKISILHYKGESSKQNSKRYNRVFYNAMLIFAKKHYSPIKYLMYYPAVKLAQMIKIISSKKNKPGANKKYRQSVFLCESEYSFELFREKHEEAKLFEVVYSDKKQAKALTEKMQHKDIVCADDLLSFSDKMECIAFSEHANIRLRSFYPETNCLL